VPLGVPAQQNQNYPTFAMLTDSEIRKTQPKDSAFKLFDGDGLFLLVRPSGERDWRMKYRVQGYEKLISLGPYPTVSLSQARLKLKRAKERLLEGVDPSVKRTTEKIAGNDSFEAIAREWFATQSTRWLPSHADKIIRRLERDIFPWIGKHPIKTLKPAHLLACLKRIEARGNLETARRAYQNICQVFRFAIATRRGAHDPCAALQGALLPTKEKRLASITDPLQFGELLRAIDAYSGSHSVRTALALAPLVFVRPGELRAAEWSEFHLGAREWRIPGVRMKAGIPHIVPLSKQAIALLKDIQPATGDGKYVFPSPRARSRPLSNVALLAALRRMGYEQGTLTVHGFRATASTLLKEKGWNRRHIEKQLAPGKRHQVRGYNYAAFLPQRKVMMQEWADYLDQLRASRVAEQNKSNWKLRRREAART
jgi:integrase